MRRLDLIIFLVAAGWVALKFISAWLEQRSARHREDEDSGKTVAGNAHKRYQPLPPPVLRPRPRVVNPRPLPPPPAESASPPELGELRDWFREALKPALPSPAPAGGGKGMAVSAVPPVMDPLEVEAEREGLDHRASSPLAMLEGQAARAATGGASFRRSSPAAAALRRAARRRSSLRQGILLAEVLSRPRAFDV